MLFNSVEFVLFFAIVVTLHFAAPHRYRWALLLGASYFFYMSWNPAYIVLILMSTMVDYGAGLGMVATTSKSRRRLLLLASLTTNLGLLFTFKYWSFFRDNSNGILASLGFSPTFPTLDFLLPVGISFYTFQTLSYTIDVYRGTLLPERHLGRFALYVSFFPQLVAGPIERARHLIPQITKHKRWDYARVTAGLQLILWGLFKKVVIADRLAIYVDAVYNNIPNHGAASYLLATYAFAFQIYCDFSGYSDIAIGSAQVLGFDLMQNFRRPYFAKTITDFWRRWHISLSTWLRDYLYISLGGNRKGLSRTYQNLLITMILGGLWHGASWNFVIWGGIHGVLLSMSKSTLTVRDTLYAALGVPDRIRDAVRVVITFNLVCLTWVFFRAATLSDAWHVVTSFLRPWGQPLFDATTALYASLGVITLLIVQMVQERKGSSRKILALSPQPLRWAVWYGMIFAIVLFGVNRGSQFIYFQF